MVHHRLTIKRIGIVGKKTVWYLPTDSEAETAAPPEVDSFDNSEADSAD